MTASLPILLPDTNYLMDYPNLDQEEWLLRPLEIMISETVTSELHGLVLNSDPLRASQAQKALETLEKFKGPLGEILSRQAGLHITFVERTRAVKPPLEALKPDHQVIAAAQGLLHARQPRYCAILSNDRELSDIAEALAVIVISRYSDLRFHQEVQRKFEWWQKSRQAGGGTSSSRARLSPSKTKNGPPEQLRLRKTVRRLLHRMKAAGSQSAVYLAPQQASIELAAQVIQATLKVKNRSVLVTVHSPAELDSWRRGIRERNLLDPAEINIWGEDPVEAFSHGRVHLCSFNQIEALFPLFMARLHQTGKRLVTIADGGDLVDPVLLAGLLHESHFFYGINHYPLSNRQAPGSRLFNLILRTSLVANYSFADAEIDGWGHPSNLNLVKIGFTQAEQEYWQELTVDYSRRQQKALLNHPELALNDNFWDALTCLLSRTVDPEDVELIRLREQREQLAQLAQNKLPQTMELLTSLPVRPYRRLVFDFERQWTPILLSACQKAGLQAAELPAGGEPRQEWDRFAANGPEVLVLSSLPPADFPLAHYQQLVILTPLRPMVETIAMIDWALTHTHTRDPLRIDLLYTTGTAEELAMLDTAEACLGRNIK